MILSSSENKAVFTLSCRCHCEEFSLSTYLINVLTYFHHTLGQGLKVSCLDARPVKREGARKKEQSSWRSVMKHGAVQLQNHPRFIRYRPHPRNSYHIRFVRFGFIFSNGGKSESSAISALRRMKEKS